MASLILLTFFQFLLSVLGESLENFAEDAEDSRRILGGEGATSIPFFIQLVIDSGKVSTTCGASLLTATGAVTSGHCIASAKKIKAYFGLRKPFGGMPREVQFWKAHPKFSVKIGANDVGVVVWKDPIPLSELISPITIGPHPKVGTELEIAGVGDVAYKKPTAYLKKVNVTILDPKKCKPSTLGIDKLFDAADKESYLCSNHEPYKGSCAGDSGGPLYSSNKGKPLLIGIISIGPSKCDAGGSLYTSASFFSKWIQSTIKCLEDNRGASTSKCGLL